MSDQLDEMAMIVNNGVDDCGDMRANGQPTQDHYTHTNPLFVNADTEDPLKDRSSHQKSRRTWLSKLSCTCIVLILVLLLAAISAATGVLTGFFTKKYSQSLMLSEDRKVTAGQDITGNLPNDNGRGQQNILQSDICGTTPAAKPRERIVGGDDARPGAWPWLGSLRAHTGFHNHQCGAVLIAPRWALTAAHCLESPRLYEVTVESIVFGDIKLDENSASHLKVEIEKIFVHPMYNRLSSWNDVAVLKLATSINFTDDVRPICLESGHNEVDYSTCYTAGWGMQNADLDNENRTTTLQEAAMTIIEIDSCRKSLNTFDPFQTALDNELCFTSSNEDQSPCYGDSGGPLMCLDHTTNRWQLVGIISHGIQCRLETAPGLAWKVSEFVPFITSILNDDGYSYKCEPIKSPCADYLPYTMTSAGLQSGLNDILELALSNNASECHPEYKQFLCMMVYYSCNADDTVYMPCEDFCIEVLASSESQCSAINSTEDLLLMLQTCAVFPSSTDTNQKICQGGNDSDCSPDRHITITHNTPFILNSAGFPNGRKLSHLDCAWIATAPSDVTVMIKFLVLDFQEDMEVLTFGLGDDPNNRASLLLKSWEPESHLPPSPLFSGANVMWIRYATNWPYDNRFKGFSLEIWATSATEHDFAQTCQNIVSRDSLNVTDVSSECDIKTCFPISWRCDRVFDCPNGADEKLCKISKDEHDERGIDPSKIQDAEEILSSTQPIIKYPYDKPTRTTAPPLQTDFQYPVNCGARDVMKYSSRIVGGAVASDGNWPWVISLRDGNGDHACGATLLSNQWAITAAHCTDHISTSVLGSTSLSSTSSHTVHIKIKHVFPHPLYNASTHEGDIAILKLERSVNFNAFIEPICIGTSDQEVESYVGCCILGWGRVSEGGRLPDRLQMATIPLLTQTQCQLYVPEITNNMLCAARLDGSADSCQGDSGGPLLCVDKRNSWHIVGVTSFGNGCGRPNSPGVYTRISQYYDFINTTIHQREGV